MYWAGLSLHACQQFEYGIKFLFVVMAEVGFGKVSTPDAVAIIEDENKKTLGQLLKLLNRTVTISAGSSSALDVGLAARNRIIHRFLLESIELIVDPMARPRVIAELKQLRTLVLAGDQAVREIIEAVYAYGGVDWQAMEQKFREEVRALNSEPQKGQGGTMPWYRIDMSSEVVPFKAPGLMTEFSKAHISARAPQDACVYLRESSAGNRTYCFSPEAVALAEALLRSFGATACSRKPDLNGFTLLKL